MARTFLAVVAVTLGLAFLFPAHAVVPPLTQPTWKELTPEQRQILAPLSGEWDGLESWRRKKWIGIAQRYPAMNPEEQARVQRRMKEWVVLSPDERKLAREKYKKLQQATPEHKEALKQKWQEYKELPDEEKQRLKAQATKAKPLPRSGKSVTAPAAAAAPMAATPLPAAPLPAAPAAAEPVALPAPAAQP